MAINVCLTTLNLSYMFEAFIFRQAITRLHFIEKCELAQSDISQGFLKEFIINRTYINRNPLNTVFKRIEFVWITFISILFVSHCFNTSGKCHFNPGKILWKQQVQMNEHPVYTHQSEKCVQIKLFNYLPYLILVQSKVQNT